MADHDRILIQPSAEELEDAVGEAVARVNGKARKGRLPWLLPGYDAFAAEISRTPEGWKQWNADARAGELRSALGVAWWTDHIGRRHVRLVGCRIDRDFVADLFGPHAAKRPPLWRVYPEHTFVCVRGGQRAVNVLCRCGAVGTPAELGWMGDCCAACHDRRESDVAVRVLWRRATFGGPNRTNGWPALSPGGDTLGINEGQELALWDVSSGQLFLSVQQSVFLFRLAFSPDGKTLAVSGISRRLILLDVPTGTEKASFPVHDLMSLAWSPDGTLIACGGMSRTVLLDADSGRTCLDLSRSVSEVTAVAFSPDSSLLATGTRGGTLQVWDTRSGEERLTLHRPRYFLTAIAFSPDWGGTLFPRHGRPVLGAVGIAESEVCDAGDSGGGTILLFPPALGEGGVPLAPASNPQGTMTGAFSPDGRTFLTGSRDGTLRIWSLPEVKEVACLEWHQNQLGHLAFSADGRLLLTAGSLDGVVRLWPWESLRSVCGV